MKKWTIDDAAELYNIKGWGINYFSINKKGNVVFQPKKNGPEVDLKEVIDELKKRDVTAPVILRFPDILNERIETMNNCFKKAAEEYEYKGTYYNIYPIKVNQVRQVVEQIMKYGARYNIGLEAGSKPELHAVLSFTQNDNALIICNGYKDESFVELALLAQKMGRRIFLVVEKLNEFKLIAEVAEKLGVSPNIGIRIKLSSEGSGKWEDSGGDRSKFGLNASELLEAVSIAKDRDLMDNIKLIHFHLGSQVTNIRKIKIALREASQFYVAMKKYGCDVQFVDIGGGLGVDYDGTRSATPSSVNYFLQEYVNDAVFTFVEASEKNDLPHPDIITESGRALTAHHCMLVINVLEAASLPKWDDSFELGESDHELVTELYDIWENLSSKRMLESWHDAQQIRGEALDLFSFGMLDLKTRAIIERLFWSITRDVYRLSLDIRHPPEEFRKLSRMLADKYFCNFSVFKSLPDSWAIDQVFPIMPIHRLHEKPGKTAALQDITCDSDGKIDLFPGIRDNANYLQIHNLRKNESYYLGIFLIGAYQEILGDMHNLFGDTNAVHIKVGSGDYQIEQIQDGHTVDEVLSKVNYNPKRLVRNVETWVAKAVEEGRISSKEGKEFLSNYKSGLYGYTYLV